MNSPTYKPLLPLVHDYLEKWAEETPDKEALIQHENGWIVNYRQLNEIVDLYVLCLLKMGIQKGERVAVMGLQSIQYVALQYACFKIGAIICPLDIKLKPHETVRALNKITPILFILGGTTHLKDFYEVGKAVLEECPYVKDVLQYNLIEDGNSEWPLLEGAKSANKLFDLEVLKNLVKDEQLLRHRQEVYAEIKENDPALIIFTTGTTGEPKPALLQHSCIVAELEIFFRASTMPGPELRRVCVLPCSHVGGTTITVYTTIYAGGTNILLHRFNPALTLEAIAKWRGNFLGAVPTMYRMIWALPNYKSYDLSSMHCAYYAGSMVDKNFLEELSKMAPNFGTSLGMTECGGVSTYTPMPLTVEEMFGQVGRAAEDVAKISIRRPMDSEGKAGEELSDGEIGEICYHPPLVFLGYFNQPEATAQTVSREGILYSGDIGYFKDMVDYKALMYMGRSKYLIKQKGYNVFPDEVAAHISMISGVAEAEVLGVKHSLFDEGVFAFILPKAGMEVKVEEVIEHCKSLAAYKRPQHVEVLAEGQGFPLTNNGKVDKNALGKMAEEIVKKLREQGKWDSICSNV
jgi:fatty-acyl-CoA synthase